MFYVSVCDYLNLLDLRMKNIVSSRMARFTSSLKAFLPYKSILILFFRVKVWRLTSRREILFIKLFLISMNSLLTISHDGARIHVIEALNSIQNYDIIAVTWIACIALFQTIPFN